MFRLFMADFFSVLIIIWSFKDSVMLKSLNSQIMWTVKVKEIFPSCWVVNDILSLSPNFNTVIHPQVEHNLVGHAQEHHH